MKTPLSENQYRARRTALYRNLEGFFNLLTNKACAYASRCKDLDRTPLEELNQFIFGWVDDALNLLYWPIPAVHHKERLSKAFAKLAADQARFPFSEKKVTHCPICHTRLVTAYSQPLVCEHCMQPVFDALDNLVRVTTIEWTPEELHEDYQEALKSVSRGRVDDP